MKTRVILSALHFCCVAGVAGPAADPAGWPEPSRQARPWAYNWWLGSAVDTNNLAHELRRYRDAGLGGIHIIPIYGAKGEKARSVKFLSPQWMELMRFAIEEGERLDLGVDMTTGTGWCFGGPNVPESQGGWRLQTRSIELAPGRKLEESFDKAAVVALGTESANGEFQDLRDKISEGKLNWSPTNKSAKILIVTAVPGGPEVKRSAPGGAGLMINPFDQAAMTNYLDVFTKAFDEYRGPIPRAMYHDSYEYNSNWAPDFLEVFARKRGYRLETQWPAFCGGPGTNDVAARVRCDFKETLSDLMVTDVFPEWIEWCRDRKFVTRYQAHGSPANLLDLYALADVPETEMFGRGTRDPLNSGFDERFGEGDRDPLISRFASSAAHVAGRRLVSSETGTWMAEHFCETLEEMKCLTDLLFVSGINHVFYHGTCYSPDDVAWPGWLFYASTEMNPRNAIWHDASALNAYITRCQSVLQSGSPDNDILLYWPIHDYWQSDPALVNAFTVHRTAWIEHQPIGDCARQLLRRGYAFDYISDRLLEGAQSDSAGNISMPGGNYRVIVVPTTELMPPETLKRLLDLASSGATVIFEKQLPQDVPGYGDLATRRKALKQALQTVAVNGGEARIGKGKLLVGEIEASLERARIRREQVVDHSGVLFTRRLQAHGSHYFIANQSTNVLNGWFALACPARSVEAMDPMSGDFGALPIRTNAGKLIEVPLRLEPGHSIILRTFTNQTPSTKPWQWLAADSSSVELSNSWQVQFLSGGPTLPKPYQLGKLESWTRNGDPETERFAGTALYRTTFDRPSGKGPWILDLGSVHNSARVRLNGRDLGTLLMRPYRLRADDFKSIGNQLEVEVTNLSANRMRDLNRHNGPAQPFYYVNIGYKPFDASNWPIFDSGLLGPVKLYHSQSTLK